MATRMRAKMKLTMVTRHENIETLQFNAVGPKGNYPSDGSDENNTYAKFTPSGELKLTVTNPDLLGIFNLGDTYYLDFTPAE